MKVKVDKWFIVYYKSRNYGNIYTYQPRDFKNSKQCLLRGSVLSMHKSRKQMLEFKEYRGKVYNRIG